MLQKPVEPHASNPIHYVGHTKVQKPNKQEPNLVSHDAKVPVTSNKYRYVPTFEIEYSYVDDDDGLASEDGKNYDPYMASRVKNQHQVQISNTVISPKANNTQNVVSRNDQSPLIADAFSTQSLNADKKVPNTVAEKLKKKSENILKNLLLYFAPKKPVSTTEFAVPQAVIVDNRPSSTFSQYPVDSQRDNTNDVLHPRETNKPPHKDDFNGIRITDLGILNVKNHRFPVVTLSKNEPKQKPSPKLPKTISPVGSQSDTMNSMHNLTKTNKFTHHYYVNDLHIINQETWQNPNTLISGKNFSDNERKHTLVEEKTPVKKEPKYMILLETPSKDVLPKSTKVVGDRNVVVPSTEKNNEPESKTMRNALLDIIYIADKLPSNLKINQKEAKPSAEKYQTNQALTGVKYIHPSEKAKQATNSGTLNIILTI